MARLERLLVDVGSGTEVFVGGAARALDKLRDRSPLVHAERLQAPLYLTHGANDHRVLVAESRAFAARRRELGKTFCYDEFSGQGHGLKGIAVQKRLWQGLFAFWEETTS